MPDDHTRTIAADLAKLDRQFEERFAAGDARGLVEGYFAPDDLKPLASGPGGQPPVRGRAALIEMFQEQMKVFAGIQLETVDIVTSDTLAQVLGRARLKLRSGETAVGRYVVLFGKTDGLGWRARLDFFAADAWTD